MHAFDRAHRAYLEVGDCPRAVRAAFWLGFRLASRGQTGPASGWFSRAKRLLQRDGEDCVERGYLLIPVIEENLAEGNFDSAMQEAKAAADIGERFQDADLLSTALHLQGRAHLRKGSVAAGLALLDEAMVAVIEGELSPIMTGLIYCSVIEACHDIYALDRAREWTSALAAWCSAQPQIVAFTGSCLAHRAEMMQLAGAWGDAIAEAGRACERYLDGFDPQPPAPAFYQRAETHRLKGDLDAAEEDYRRASQFGHEPQPGLALLRLAQGRKDAAAASMRRVMGTTTDCLQRARLLPAYVEISIAAGELVEAKQACGELEEIAEVFESAVLRAMADQARGAVSLADGDTGAALVALRRAFAVWNAIEAPYEAARVRVQIGLACRAQGDGDGAELEFAAATAVFSRLGAHPDLRGMEELVARPRAKSHGLSQRELQVLRLLATGKTNKAIADELFLSERTIERHVSNIFIKLDLSSRAAATAWAYQHVLV
nr:helix-turn-helix transcriptional regulator [Nitratireductor luteus]